MIILRYFEKKKVAVVQTRWQNNALAGKKKEKFEEGSKEISRNRLFASKVRKTFQNVSLEYVTTKHQTYLEIKACLFFFFLKTCH